MERTELINLARSRIRNLEELGVPDMMRNGEEKELLKILENWDYSDFNSEETKCPRFSISELRIDSSDEILAVMFDIWGNPFLHGGDFSYFETPPEFIDLLKKSDDLLCSKLGHSVETKWISKFDENGINVSELIGLAS